MTEPAFTYRRGGLALAIYDDRIEMVRGVLWQPRRIKVIPISTITAVSGEGLAGGRLRIETAGGHEDLTIGRQAEAARQAIAGRLR